MTFLNPSPDHTIWLSPYEAAFVYLPKVACTSWKLHLAKALGVVPTETLTYKNLHDKDVLPLPYVSSLKNQQYHDFALKNQSTEFYYLSVIREPKERAASAYLDKIFFHTNPDSFFSRHVIPSIQAHTNLPSDQKPSFENFLYWIKYSEDPSTKNDHWLPMSSILGLDLNNNLPDNLYCWTMKSIDKAVDALNKLLDYDGPFPSREELGPRPDRKSKDALPNLISDNVNLLLSDIYCDDINLYTLASESELFTFKRKNN